MTVAVLVEMGMFHPFRQAKEIMEVGLLVAPVAVVVERLPWGQMKLQAFGEVMAVLEPHLPFQVLQ